MNKEELKQVIPHREPMLLVDKAEIVGDESVSEFTIPHDAHFTQGHFPGNPIVPGVILCEIMAQGSALLMQEQLKDKLALYSGLDNIRFKHVVRPGDTVVTRSRIVLTRGPLVVIDAVATVDDNLCSKGRLSFILTDKKQ